jgi:penicillin-binding protein 2
MFHRRLLLIGGLMLIVMLGLAAQLFRLSVLEKSERRQRAEASLQRQTLLPTYRGSIVDRHGRRLAVDRPGYAVAVEYEVIDGSWVARQARRAARREVGASIWATLGAEEKDALQDEHRPAWEEKVERLKEGICRYGKITRATLDEELASIHGRVERLAGRVRERQQADEERRYGADGTYVFRPRPITEQRQAHQVVMGISDEAAFALRALAAEMPGMLEIQESRAREQPWATASVPLDRRSLPSPVASDTPISITVHGVADHILGAVSTVRAEDIERRPYRRRDGTVDLGGYRQIGDKVGTRGVEEVFEDHLRGTRGRLSRRIDTGVEERTDPVAGGSLQLTIDIVLQARIQALCTEELGLTTVQAFHQNPKLPLGWPLNSAAVVIEIETGEILAMVSMPTRAMGRAMWDIDRQRTVIDHPWVNRPAEGIYPPGSIIKPIVLVSGITEGVHQLDQPITCTGQYFPTSKRPRCWIYRERWDFATHEEVFASDALAQSCNIYFYTLAERLGMATLTDWYARFGLGAPLDIGLGIEREGRRQGELGGSLLPPKEIELMPASRKRRTTVAMGIGQGEGVTWTPLHAANAYAILARGGRMRDATLVRDDPRGDRRRTLGRVHLDPAAVQSALDGLRGAVTAGGTGHQFSLPDGTRESILNAPGVTVWAKTGTAQAPPLRIADTNGDDKINSKDDRIDELDHAWFVGLVGPEDTGTPTHAIAVIVEYGGSGGRVAGPLANQVVRALQEEGYLPGSPLVSAEAAP